VRTSSRDFAGTRSFESIERQCDSAAALRDNTITVFTVLTANSVVEESDVNVAVVVIVVVVVALIVAALSIRVVTQYEKGVLFRLGRVIGVREPGLTFIIPVADRLRKVSLRIVTMPIQSQGIITRDNVSVDIAAVAYFRVVDAVKSVVAIENVHAAIDQIAQTTLRNVVGQHTLDEALADTEVINANIRQILDVITLEWGVEVTLVELKDIQLPDSMKRAMARQAEAEREKRAKIIAAEGESLAAAALGDASDTMMAHPLALQLRNLQTLVELGVDKNTTVVFPAPLMSAIGDVGSFFARETAAASTVLEPPIAVPSTQQAQRPTPAANGAAAPAPDIHHSAV
jgi:regulator of protease activity HflC (stomatin/prohibitin superfamily)